MRSAIRVGASLSVVLTTVFSVQLSTSAEEPKRRLTPIVRSGGAGINGFQSAEMQARSAAILNPGSLTPIPGQRGYMSPRAATGIPQPGIYSGPNPAATLLNSPYFNPTIGYGYRTPYGGVGVYSPIGYPFGNDFGATNPYPYGYVPHNLGSTPPEPQASSQPEPTPAGQLDASKFSAPPRLTGPVAEGTSTTKATRTRTTAKSRGSRSKTKSRASNVDRAKSTSKSDQATTEKAKDSSSTGKPQDDSTPAPSETAPRTP